MNICRRNPGSQFTSPEEGKHFHKLMCSYKTYPIFLNDKGINCNICDDKKKSIGGQFHFFSKPNCTYNVKKLDSQILQSRNNYTKSNSCEEKMKINKKIYFLGNSRQLSHFSAKKNKNSMIDGQIVQVVCDNFNKGKLTNTILSEVPKKW